MSDIAEDIRSAMQETAPADTAPTTEAVEVEASEVPDAPTGEDRQSTSERDTSGRFAPKTPSKNNESLSADEQPTTQGVEQPAQPQTQAPAKAPISWKPEAREEWAKAPPAIQQEVMRREREITDALRNTAESRHFQQQFNQVAAPYAHILQAERATPVQAFQNLMQTAVTLRVGTPQQKAALVSELIQAHGIDIQQLDDILSAKYSGRAPAHNPQNDVVQLIDQRLAPFQQFLQSQQNQQQQVYQQQMQTLQQETTDFLNNPEYEFANDLAGDIADILDLAANRGQKISLHDAYNRATMLHPTISDIIQRRKVGQGAASGSEAAIRARRAAASISDNGAPSRASEGEDGDDIRSALTASMRTLNRR